MLWLFVGPTRVCLLDFFCSSVRFGLLLGPSPCFVSLLCLDLCVFGGWCVGWLGVFRAGQISMCLDPHLNEGWGWRRWTGLGPPVKYFTYRSKAVLLLWLFYVFVLSCVCYVFMRVCLYVLCGHLLGKGWPLGSRLWCLLWGCHFPILILGQVWYLIVSIPDLCTLTYFHPYLNTEMVKVNDIYHLS